MSSLIKMCCCTFPLVIRMRENNNNNILLGKVQWQTRVTCPGSSAVLRDRNLPKHLIRKNNAVYSYIYNSFASECPALSWHCLIYIQLHMKDHYSYVKTKQPIPVPSEPRPRATRFSLPPLACLKVTSLFPRQLLLIRSCWQCKFLPCAVRHSHQPATQRGGAALCLAQLENFLLFSQSSPGQVYLLHINPGHPIHSMSCCHRALCRQLLPRQGLDNFQLCFPSCKKTFLLLKQLSMCIENNRRTLKSWGISLTRDIYCYCWGFLFWFWIS